MRSIAVAVLVLALPFPFRCRSASDCSESQLRAAQTKCEADCLTRGQRSTTVEDCTPDRDGDPMFMCGCKP